jgi:hypothetical protein
LSLLNRRSFFVSRSLLPRYLFSRNLVSQCGFFLLLFAADGKNFANKNKLSSRMYQLLSNEVFF